jgi:hypothetical protein
LITTYDLAGIEKARELGIRPNRHRVLRQGGYVCIRDGTRESDFPHKHFFPAPRTLIDSDLPSRRDIKTVFAANGFTHVVHQVATQVTATDWPSSCLPGVDDEFFLRDGHAAEVTVSCRTSRLTPKPESANDYFGKNCPLWRGLSYRYFQLVRLLRLRLHMVRDDEPVAVNFLVDIGDEIVELGRITILHFLFAGFLTHLPREVAVDVNMLV